MSSEAGLRALAVLRADVGLLELGVNDGPVLKYEGRKGDPWCGHSVAWSFRVTGNPLPGDDKISFVTGKRLVGWVEWQVKQLKAAGWFYLPPHLHPEPGDIIYFHGSRWHCGLVEFVEAGWVHTIEGNVRDQVARRRYRLTNKRIAGYARVPDRGEENGRIPE